MALKLMVESLDDVEEGFRPLYEEADGKFKLNVEGIEDTSGLKSALEKERKAARDANAARKALETKYEGVDPDRFRQIMSRFENDEEAKLIAEGKYDAVVAKRTEKLREEFERQLKDASGREKQAIERSNKFSQRVLDNHIRAAAAQAGLHKHAIEDALFRARSMFTLGDDGDAIQLDADRQPILGKDGKTPFSPLEWLEGMKETAPHWFPAGSSGGGATGDGGARGAAKTMKRATFDSLPPSDRAAFVKSGGRLID